MRNPLTALADLLLTRKKDREDISQAHTDLEQARRSAEESRAVLTRAGRRIDPLEREVRAAYRGERRA